MLSFKHDSHSLKIEDFEINYIKTITPISKGGGGQIFKYITKKDLWLVLDINFKFQSQSLKLGFYNTPHQHFNPISNKGECCFY